MKKLTPEELSSLTEEKAWEIADSFAAHLEKGKKFIEFDSVLKYERSTILVALLFLLRNNPDPTFIKVISNNIVILFDGFIPSEESYTQKIEIMQKINNLS